MKKMNSPLWAIALVLLLSACGGSKNEASTDTVVAEAVSSTLSGKVDINASNVSWKGSMVGMYDHMGTVQLKAADVKVEEGSIVGGKFAIDMTSITPTDKNFDVEKGSTPEKLIGHLSSADFFDVENNPESSFEITGATEGALTGKLTLRGKTDAETVKISSMIEENGVWKVIGTLTFDRKKYGVAFDHPMKDMVVSDDVEITIELIIS